MDLKIEKDGLIKGGNITYTVAKNGTVEWSGKIKINMGLSVSTKSFSGSHKLPEDFVRSEFYKKKKGFIYKDAEITVNPLEKIKSEVHISHDKTNGSGVLNTSYTKVEVESAAFNVEAYGIKFKVRVTAC